MTTSFWDQRYADDTLVYGEAPNDFLAQMAARLPRTGAALDIGAGEGRNALFLASLGLDTLAMDQSAVGMQKAQRRALQRGLKLRTQAADLQDFTLPTASLDVVSSIFVHLPTALRSSVHARIASWLKPGGLFLHESYAPDQLQRTTGGPKDPSMLPSLETVLSELGDAFTIEHKAALVRNVTEGTCHSGEASVVQVLARRR